MQVDSGSSLPPSPSESKQVAVEQFLFDALTSKNRNYFTATAKAHASNKCHLRGLGGRSQRHVIETHISYGVPSSTDTRCPPAYQTMKLAIVLDNRRNAGKVQIQRDDRHDNDHCCDQLVVQMRKHLLAATSLAQHINGNGRGK